MKIIFNADDFGLCESVSKGIIEAHKNGLVKSTTILANGMYFEEAVKLAKTYENLGVGVHLALSLLKPLTLSPTLTDKNGDFHKQQYYLDNIVKLEEIETEFEAQINKVIDSGLKITHLDGHHHLYALIPGVLEITKKLAKKYNVLIRNYHNEPLDEVYLTSFNDKYFDKIEFNDLVNIINTYQKDDVVEIMCHPSLLGSDLNDITSYVTKRKDELDVLTSNELKEFVKLNEIDIINYKELKKC